MDRARRPETNGEKDDRVTSLYKVSVFILGWGPTGSVWGDASAVFPCRKGWSNGVMNGT